MIDRLTPQERSEVMRRIRGKHTKPELLVRSLVHRLGYRFRLHRRDLPGKPDLVFPTRKKVIFVNGCFWHYHDDPDCKRARLPKSNQEFWTPKLQGNRERDKQNQARLNELGWEVLVIWECQIPRKDPELLRQQIRLFLEQHPKPKT